MVNVLGDVEATAYSELQELYEKYGSYIVEKVRLAKNFERYCATRTVRWGYGKKRLEKEFKELGQISLAGMCLADDNKVVKNFDLYNLIRFNFTLDLPDAPDTAQDPVSFVAAYGITYLQEYGEWKVEVIGDYRVESLVEAYKILTKLDDQKNMEIAATKRTSLLRYDDYSKWF